MVKGYCTILLMTIMLLVSSGLQAQTTTDSPGIRKEKKFQAKPGRTQAFGAEAFKDSNKTTIRWLGMTGFLINSRGTTLMVDPLLKGFDMPVMIDFPIKTKDVPQLDGILITHSDNDHYSVPTCLDLKGVTKEFHSTIYVDSLMKNDGLTSFGHNIGDTFKIGSVSVKLTPVEHRWQNAYPGASKRTFKKEDACGFWIETPDGNIWVTGDSRFLDEQLDMPTPDAILFFYSPDSVWHHGIEGTIKIANAYPNTPIILSHWGTVDAPDFTPFNGNPKDLQDKVVNPNRIYALAPGQPFTLKKVKKSK